MWKYSMMRCFQVHLKFLAEEMQAVSKSLGKVEQELTASESDGPVSERFRKVWAYIDTIY